ncbi:MAG: hypothetical protein KKI09_02125 [Spirochaetes bacterium]|nr:hypothetical protein [Spirochaetota bacterium]
MLIIAKEIGSLLKLLESELRKSGEDSPYTIMDLWLAAQAGAHSPNWLVSALNGFFIMLVQVGSKLTNAITSK